MHAQRCVSLQSLFLSILPYMELKRDMNMVYICSPKCEYLAPLQKSPNYTQYTRVIIINLWDVLNDADRSMACMHVLILYVHGIR